MLSFVVIRCYLLLFVVCQLFSLVIIHCITRCHSLCHSLLLVITCCTTRCHSLSFVFTWCTTHLSFYKGSTWWVKIVSKTKNTLYQSACLKSGEKFWSSRWYKIRFWSTETQMHIQQGIQTKSKNVLPQPNFPSFRFRSIFC